MITLAQLEQEVARRVGPYWRFFIDRQIPNTAQFTFANVPELRTNIDSDLVTNLWLLRRGERYGTPAIVSMDPVDRQRSVDVYDAEQGRLFPDRPWGVIPTAGEYFEFHHLNPDQELRPSVLAGLARCFFQDLNQLQSVQTVPYSGVDLTAQFAWITEPWQVANVQYGWYTATSTAPYRCVSQRGHVWLMGTTTWPAPASLWITTWRPVTSWVNEADSLTGPTDDADTLNVDLAYAASAGHIEAWHLYPDRLAAAAAGGLQATQQMTAAEFSRQALFHGPVRSSNYGFSSIVGGGHDHVWVNR